MEQLTRAKPEWAGDVVRDLFLYGITQKELADELDVTNRYLCMLLGGARHVEGSDLKIRAALDAIIARKKSDKQD